MISISGYERKAQNLSRQVNMGKFSPSLVLKIAHGLQEEGKRLFREDPCNYKIVEVNSVINRALSQIANAHQDPLLKGKVQKQSKSYQVLIEESLADKSNLLRVRYEKLDVLTKNLIKRPHSETGSVVSLRKAKDLQMQWSSFLEELDQEYRKWLPFFCREHGLMDNLLNDVLTLTYKSHERLVDLERCFELSPVLKDDACMQVLALNDLI